MGERVLVYGNVHGSDRGGVQTVCRRLAAHLRGRGHRVALAWAQGADGRTPEQPAVRLPPLTWRRGRREALGASAAMVQLVSYLARVRPTVVNFHFVTGAAAYFLLLKPLFGYRLVLSVHGSDVLRPQAEDAPLLPRIFSRGDAITTVSRITTTALRGVAEIDERRVHLIPNGIDVDFWSGARVTPATLPGRSIVSVGRLDPVKGHDVLLRAFAEVLGKCPGTGLVLVGEGGFRAQLTQLATELRIGAAVTFAGQLAPEEVRAHLASAALFVLPSRSEGLPLALLEAMAAGVPSVAAEVGGVPEVLSPGTGLLVAPDDCASLAAALTALLLDAPRRAALAQRGKERALAFRADAADRAYEAVLCRPGVAAPARLLA